jgi:hypothetical protein
MLFEARMLWLSHLPQLAVDDEIGLVGFEVYLWQSLGSPPMTRSYQMTEKRRWVSWLIHHRFDSFVCPFLQQQEQVGLHTTATNTLLGDFGKRIK